MGPLARQLVTNKNKKRFDFWTINPNLWTHPPWKKRDLVQKNDFHREFTENFRQTGIKYAIKTVIYKSLGPLEPNHQYLGQSSIYKSEPRWS